MAAVRDKSESRRRIDDKFRKKLTVVVRVTKEVVNKHSGAMFRIARQRRGLLNLKVHQWDRYFPGFQCRDASVDICDSIVDAQCEQRAQRGALCLHRAGSEVEEGDRIFRILGKPR